MVSDAGETASFDTMMKRRRYLGAMAGALLSMRFAAAMAQAGNVPRIGFLLFNSPRAEPIEPLLQGLQAMGYVDGKTIAIEYRFAEGKPERLPDLAAELVQLKPDVIFALGGDVASLRKRQRHRSQSLPGQATIRWKAGW